MQTALSPGEFSRRLLHTLAASDGRRKRRKRNTTPDAIGLDLKRELLERAAAADPAPEVFEAWLLQQALGAPAGGPVRAMCAEIWDEYAVARQDPEFSAWLAEGAPSEDAEPD
ncbi:MAG TPA: type III secretion fhipep protein [Chloroflexota bacterium]|nr:type III secretion fhipep protein [Chloroflexota bacterium]